MQINNTSTPSNDPATESTLNTQRDRFEHSASWVRPNPGHFGWGDGYCPCPPRANHDAIIAQLQSLISMISDLLRRIGGRPLIPAPPKPPTPIEVKPTPPELRRFVGMSVREAEAQARREGITSIRIIDSVRPITADYRMNRLNLNVNEYGIVTRADWY